MIKIIGGSAKGRKIRGPEGYEFRPTTGRVKEFIFSVLRNEVEGALFLDLFSGTGSFGIEAISRGAERVVFVEKARSSIEILKYNIKLCKFSDQVKIVKGDVFRVVRQFDENKKKFDYIFADPPFKGMLREKIAEAVGETSILKDNGVLIIEHERRDLDKGNHSMVQVRENFFGGSVVSIYKQGVEE